MINLSFYPLIILKVVENKDLFKIMIYQKIIEKLGLIKEIFYKLHEYNIFKICITIE